MIWDALFIIEQVIYDQRQAGQTGKNGDEPKEAGLDHGNQLNTFVWKKILLFTFSLILINLTRKISKKIILPFIRIT